MQHKIIVVVGSLDIGGTERHILEIMPRLDREKFVIQVCTLTYRGDLADALEAQGILVSSPLKKDSGPPRSWFNNRIALLHASYWLFKTLYKEKPDIVHFFLPASYIVGAICAIFARCPKRIMSRRCMNVYQKKYPGISYLERLLHKTMTEIVGNAQAVVEELKQEGVPTSKLGLIYNGVNLERPYVDHMALRRKLGITETTLVLIIVANLIPYKGHADLLQALGKVAQNISQDWTLLCVGHDTGICQVLQSLSRTLNIIDNVKFLGKRDDVEQLLTISDIGILCSHEEGFPNSILEGMAMGLPMIVTDVGGNAEAIVDGITGLVVPPKDPLTLGKVIINLANDVALRQRIGGQARARAEEFFSIDDCTYAYETLYNETIFHR